MTIDKNQSIAEVVARIDERMRGMEKSLNGGLKAPPLGGLGILKVAIPLIAIVVFLASIVFHAQDGNIHEQPEAKVTRVERVMSPVRDLAEKNEGRSIRNEVNAEAFDKRLDELREGQLAILQEIRRLHNQK